MKWSAEAFFEIEINEDDLLTLSKRMQEAKRNAIPGQIVRIRLDHNFMIYSKVATNKAGEFYGKKMDRDIQGPT